MEKYKPNISVSVQIINDEEVLLLRRFNTGYQDGKYEFPSGHIEAGESLIVAAVREVYEETGLQIQENDLQFICCLDNHTEGKHVNFLFRTNKFIGLPKIMEPEECDDIIWEKLTKLISEKENLSIDTKRFIDMVQSNMVLKIYTSGIND